MICDSLAPMGLKSNRKLWLKHGNDVSMTWSMKLPLLKRKNIQQIIMISRFPFLMYTLRIRLNYKNWNNDFYFYLFTVTACILRTLITTFCYLMQIYCFNK